MRAQALEHLSEQTLEDYRQRLLSAEEKSAVHDHVADCEDCRLRFKRRLYSTDDEKAEAGKRLINILTSLREERLRQEPPHINEEVATPLPLIPKGESAREFRRPRLRYVAALAALIIVGGLIMVPRYQRIEDVADHNSPFAYSYESPPPKNRAENQANEVLPPKPPVITNTNSAQHVATERPSDRRNSSTGEPKRIARLPKLNKRLNDAGSVIALDQEGRVAGLESAPPSFQQAARQALNGRIDVPPVVAELRSEESGVTRSTNVPNVKKARVVLIEPVNRIIRTERPTFKWEALPSSKYYLVKIVDNEFNSLEQSNKLTETQWTATKPLSSEVKYYIWQVEAYAEEGGEPILISSSRVKVLDQAKAQELRVAETEYANSHLLLGSLYAQAGLLDEAEREFQLLLRANPKSPVAQRLLRTVQERKQPPSK